MGPVLVTGGAGYIGSHACKELYRAGAEAVIYDNLSVGRREYVKYGRLIVGELDDIPLLVDTLRRYEIQAVLHFAASAYVGESMQDPQKYFRNNVGGTIHLLEALRLTGVNRIVFSSSCATYGLPSRLPIDEDSPQRPVNPYGDSKLFVEKMLRWEADAYGLRSVILRYFNAAGADPDGELGEAHEPETHLVPLAIFAALGLTERLEVFGSDYDTADGTAVRDFVHVTDLAAAHVAALRKMDAAEGCEAYNLGVGRGVSVRELVRCVEEVAGRPLPVDYRPRRPGDPPALVAAADRAQSELGWRPRHSDVHTIVDTAWRWHSRTEVAASGGSAAQR